MAGKSVGKEKAGKGKKTVDKGDAAVATSGSTATSEPAAPEGETKKMVLTLKSKDKRERNAIYTGAAVSIRIPLAAFPDKTPPATLSDFSGLAEKKPKLTAEERKEARKNAPKPTLAERVAAAEKRAAALREKLAKEAPAV